MQETRFYGKHDTLSLDNIQRRRSRPSNVIPVIEAIRPEITPLEAYLKLKSPGAYSFLLESADTGGKSAKYSFIGSSGSVISIKDGEISIDGSIVENYPGGPVKLLKDIMAGFKPARPVFVHEESFYGYNPQVPVFFGGLAGYISYDFIRYVDNIGDTADDDIGCQDAELLFVKDLVVYDHEQKMTLLVSSAIDDGNDRDGQVKAAIGRIRSMKEAMKGETPRFEEHASGEQHMEVKFSTSREQFVKMVERAKEYILDGDAFQIVLSQRAEITADIDPVALYRALKEINPSPYMYFLEFGDTVIAGSSPEILAKVEDRKVTVRPIAGTRPRGATEEDDKRLEDEMKADPKELAEHVMLVDLGRNDAGKVSRFGTVVVNDYLAVEKYSHVQHIVSNVVGELQDDKDAIDVLAATFPAGTVSGAPKTRAMQIIEELEGRRRGLYAGCVGYFCFNDNADLAIAIRTILLKNGKAYVQAGAGIVTDSVPENEYVESMNKGAAMMKAIGYAIKGGK
ncbi:anthranilate synthase component I [Methanocella sp. CWC-04]|uniref:Anthranilate synthase component 1 n=1 Tax=Methanooceanicella nereidis TaxID=2052831 RepID=A0AAP2REP6_9EURY|nr:anthranilate synthase component I [Methanocella sp. CWC-04]MCD1296344.1 anthranilate synthase component I [Methanocella sp. CWC-04]